MAIEIIKRNLEYRKVFSQGRYKVNQLLVLYRYKNNQGKRRFGFTVSKKVGKAVVRNRVRRVLKETCRHNEQMFPADSDYVVVARPAASKANYNELANSLHKLLGSLK